MLDKQIKNNEIILTEKVPLSEDFITRRKKYQAKYGNKTKYCEICDKYIKTFSWQNHNRSKTHKLKKEIQELKQEISNK